MITLNKVHRLYHSVKSDLHRQMKEGDYIGALNAIDTYARLVQQVNDIFRDDEVEQALQVIGEEVIGVIPETRDSHQAKKIVFFDQIGTTICLGLQYLRALKVLGYEILYIFENKYMDINPALKKEVEEICSACEFHHENYSIEEAKKIQKEILSFGASKIIVHSPAFGALGCAVLYSLPGMERYRVVPGDHHFYIGIDCIDHFFEFRNFGVNVSLQRRNIPHEKIYLLPYYPIISSTTDFKGFPSEAEGKVVIAAAANEYKFHGSNWFFVFCEKLLKEHKNVVILFIGGKSSKVEKFVTEKRLNGRFLLLGYRKDFIECMKHIDLFFNSYPTGSGLTSMTAAFFERPIISLHNKEYESQSLNHIFPFSNGLTVSYSDEKSLRTHVDRLIDDVNLRHNEGKKLKESLQTESNFIKMLGDVLGHKCNKCEYVSIDLSFLQLRVNQYIELLNSFTPSVYKIMLRDYGWRTIMRDPHLLFDKDFLTYVWKLYWQKK